MMKVQNKSFGRKVVSAGALVAMSGVAFAQEGGAGGIDVSTIVTLILGSAAACGAIAIARLTVLGGIKAYKMVSRAM